MQNIPIVVSRLTSSGKKEVFTVRDTIPNDQSIQNKYKINNQFLTMDYANVDKQKQSKMRIRRIQSSGSRRKFPKDFFSRQSNRPKRETISKQNNLGQSLNQQHLCSEITNNLKESNQQQVLETPKFKQKYQTSNTSQQVVYKNQTLRQTITKFISKNQNQNESFIKMRPAVPITCFQNTFSQNQLKKMNWKSQKPQSQKLIKFDKQNISTKKYKVNKQYLVKKIAMFKERPPLTKQKNNIQ